VSNRRQFITLLGGAVAASSVSCPLAARAQQAERMRRIGVLMAAAEDDLQGKANLSGFRQGLAELGWAEGRNVRMDFRWAPTSVDQMRAFAKELVDLQPDMILANTTPAIASLQSETRAIPIIFAAISDPVGPGFVTSLSRPGGNITGFINFEALLAGKWLELLTEITPGLMRAAIMFNPDTAPYVRSYFLPAFEAAARSLKVTPVVAPVRGDAEIEQVIISLGREPGSGLVVMPDSFTLLYRAPIILLAARNSVPAVYNASGFVRDGGLLSYGPDFVDIYRRVATYADRILKGTKPDELPVQVPTKFELVVNLRTAKALGLTVSPALLARADEVIE
jgi:putative tryptophan/tyrosine transport system substrate-binding protein